MDRRTRPILLPFSLTRSAKKELDEAQSQSELAQSLACSPILSRIDYCNAVFHGASSYSINKLQEVQNNAARITTTSWRYTDLFIIIIIMVGVPEVGTKINTRNYNSDGQSSERFSSAKLSCSRVALLFF